MRDELPDPARQPAIDQQGSGTESTYPSVAELAADLHLSERSTRAALRRGEIPHIRVGRRFILPKAAIADWLRSASRGVQPDDARPALADAGRAEVTVMRRAVSR